MTPQGPSSRLLAFVGDRRGDRRARDLHDPNGLHATASLFRSDRKEVAPILALIRRAIPAPSHPAIPVPRSEPSNCPPRHIRDLASPRAARLVMAAERLRYERPPVLEPSLSAPAENNKRPIQFFFILYLLATALCLQPHKLSRRSPTTEARAETMLQAVRKVRPQPRH
jgi:hypothetical protein